MDAGQQEEMIGKMAAFGADQLMYYKPWN